MSRPATVPTFSPGSLAGGTSAGDLPAPLAEAFERVAATCLLRFEKTFGPGLALTCTLGGLANESAGEILETLAPRAVNALFDVPLAGSRLFVSLDHDFLQLFIELMCGGTGTEPADPAPRPGTAIDRQFARVALGLLAETIEKEGLAYGLGPVSFTQIEKKLDPTILGKAGTRHAVATLDLDCGGRGASLRVALPPAVVDRFRQAVLPAGDAPIAADPVWTEHFQAEIGRTSVRLDALIEASALTLGEVASLRLGQVLPLPRTALQRCDLRNGEKLLFRCEVGQADGRYSLRIDDVAPEAAETAAHGHPLSVLLP